MAEYEDSRGWMLGAPFGEWPRDPQVSAIQTELAAEPENTTLGPKFRAELRERLYARGIVPEDWLTRAYDRRAALSRAEGLIEHKAFVHLAHAPQRMVTAEKFARTLFKDAHFAGWVSPDEVHIIGDVDPYRPESVTSFFVHGIHPQHIVQLWLDELVCNDWATFFEAVRREYPAWNPLFELGVVPWLVVGRGTKLIRASGTKLHYFLSSAYTVRARATFQEDTPSPELFTA